MSSVRPWLAMFDWEVVTAQNAVLCQAKNALHKVTSEGHDATKALWNSRHKLPMTLEEAADLCRLCHRMAPFCFYNGNTFASVIRLVIKKLDCRPTRVWLFAVLPRTLWRGWQPPRSRRPFGRSVRGLGKGCGGRNRSLEQEQVTVTRGGHFSLPPKLPSLRLLRHVPIIFRPRGWRGRWRF